MEEYRETSQNLLKSPNLSKLPRRQFCEIIMRLSPRRRIRGIEACHARKFSENLQKSAKIEEMIHTIIPIWVLKIAEKAKEYLQI